MERNDRRSLNEADIIILLLSADFVDSDYCHDIEMARALERHNRGEAVVIPVVLREFDFKGLPLAGIQMLPPDGVAVTTYENHDRLFKQVAEGIRTVISRYKTKLIATHKGAIGSDWLPQNRSLDASVAREIPEGESREVAVMIRLDASDGLRFALEQDYHRPQVRELVQDPDNVVTFDRTFSAAIDDVRSTPFTIDFPLAGPNATGLPMILRVNSPDFNPQQQQKKIVIPALQDSQPFMFFVRTDRPGEHRLNVERLCDDVAVVERLLLTRSVRPQPSPGGAMAVVVASLPSSVICVAKATGAGA